MRGRRRCVTGSSVALGAGALSVTLLVGLAIAAAGDFDSSFSGDGRLKLDSGAEENGAAIAVQPDGKIVVAGTTFKPSMVVGGTAIQDALVYRLKPNGDSPQPFDTGFGVNGAVKIDSGGEEEARGIAIQADGKIVVAGNTTVNNDAAVYRLNPNGSPDTSFNLDGAYGPDSGGLESLTAVAVQPDGKIIAAGYTSNGTTGGDGVVYRLLPNADDPQPFDTGFGVNGTVKIDSGGDEEVNAMAIQPDGKIVVAGDTSVNKDAAVYRLNTNGSPDPTFNLDGAYGPDSGGAEIATGVAIQPDGKIVVVGYTTGPASREVVVYRLKPNADDPQPFDTGFGVNGTVRLTGGGADRARAVVIQPDGKIIVVGQTSADDNSIVYRLNPDGSRDTSFGANGQLATTEGGSEVLQAVALQPDGRILASGYTTNGASGSDALVYRIKGADDGLGSNVGPGGPGSGVGPGEPGTGTATPTRDARCAGVKVTRSGTARRDVIRGTSKRDVIAGLGGNDLIFGLGGNDLICGGAGNDTISGGGGRDRLYGQAGNDTLRGGAAADTLDGGLGNDKLFGDAGGDTLRGAAGRDRLTGGPGVDKLLGGPGRNIKRQ